MKKVYRSNSKQNYILARDISNSRCEPKGLLEMNPFLIHFGKKVMILQKSRHLRCYPFGIYKPF